MVHYNFKKQLPPIMPSRRHPAAVLQSQGWRCLDQKPIKVRGKGLLAAKILAELKPKMGNIMAQFGSRGCPPKEWEAYLAQSGKCWRKNMGKSPAKFRG